MNNKVSIERIKTSLDLKVLNISGQPGDSLEKHQVDQGALLLVSTGSIIYKEEERLLTLSAGESCDIPAEVIHQVTCTTNAKFFVIMSDRTKMKFER